jgi:diacylglycerol O-acyltransferase
MSALSPTDSAFLWMETRNQPMHVAGLNIYTPPKGCRAGLCGRLVAEWGKSLKALAPFNLRPVLRMGMWYWDEGHRF